MKLMKNSNDSYRVTNCRSGELHTDQTIELEESIKNKLIGQKQLKRRMFELEQDIANIEYIVRKCQEEADTIKAFTEGNLKPKYYTPLRNESLCQLFRALTKVAMDFS